MNIFSRITLRNLKKNRTRTLVTIVGIMLSAAMFSAVTFTVSSLQNFLVNYELYENGGWHAAGGGVTEEQLTELRACDRIDDLVTLKLLGFSYLEDGQNAYKPYLCVQEMSEGFADMVPVHITEGRMPQNASEIILPEHLSDDGGITYRLGDTLMLMLGDRMSGEVRLDNYNAYYPVEEGGEPERLEQLHEVGYTVVGFYERPKFEEYGAPGYTALTVAEPQSGAKAEENSALYEVYISMKNAGETDSFMRKQELMERWQINYGLLRVTAESGEDSFNRVFYGLGAILILIIMFGSISLIYNAFSISLSERTRQFGILASVGATKSQLVKSVLTEGFFLAVIGIPLGILAGLLGMGVTFRYLGNGLAEFFVSTEQIKLTLHPSVPALLTAIAVSLLTILISAFLPAKRAAKKSAIDAIRQSNDVRIRAKKLKLTPIAGKLFGFEGTIATKNYKRNRKKYRATVFSLFISVVLFISASSFGAYLERSVGYIYEDCDYNVELIYQPTAGDGMEYDDIERQIASENGVVRSARYSSIDYVPVGINKAAVDKRYLDNLFFFEKQSYGDGFTIPEEVLVYARIVFVEDEEFKDYLESLGLDEAEYFNPASPKAVAVDDLREYDFADEKYKTYRVFDDAEGAGLTFRPIRTVDGYSDSGYEVLDTGEYVFCYDSYEGEEELKLPVEEATAAVPIVCDTVADKGPSLAAAVSSTLMLYLPESQMEHVLDFYIREYEEKGMAAKSDVTKQDSYLYYNLPLLPFSEYLTMYYPIVCDNHKELAAELKAWMSDNGLFGFVQDYDESMEENRTVLLIVRVFSYGFIILISLIAAANVFNTISTNVNLRRREFAMLKSVGLTPRGFNRMMVFECLLYGIKGLLYGLPVSVLMTYLIYDTVREGVELSFFIPWYSVVIAVASVFLVVSASMVYAVRKLRGNNMIDELRIENI